MKDSPEAPPILQVERLSKWFGHRQAIVELDMAVHQGQTLTIFGPNGAGKTTLIRCVVGLTRPASGRVLLWGRPCRDEHGARRLGLVGHRSMVYDHLTVEENLRFFAALYDVSDPKERIAELVCHFGLEAHADQPASTLSRGLLQRLALARSVVHDPELLILDEPFTGLDQAACALLTGQLRDWRQAGKTILLTTHQTELGLACCSRVAVLASGRLLLMCDRASIDEAAFSENYLAYAECLATTQRLR